MSRFHLPFSVIMLSSFTSIRGRDMHDGADSPNGFISHMLQMSSQASIPNAGLCVFCLILRVRNSDTFHSIGKQVS